MIQVENNDLKRVGVKIGFIQGNYILDHNGHKLGYFENNKIFNIASKELGYIEGEYLKMPNNNVGIRLEDNHKEVDGGIISDLCRAAIRLLLG